MDATVNTSDAFSHIQTHSSLESAWNSCDRADWMIWFLESALQMSLLESEFDFWRFGCSLSGALARA